MTFREAAMLVLAEARTPLTIRELSDRIHQRGLVSTGGATPEATLSAALYRALRRDPNGTLVRLGEPGRARTARGTVRWAIRSTVDAGTRKA